MSEHQTSTPYAPPGPTGHPASPYDAPPAWIPTAPTSFADPAAPIPAPRRTFRGRMAAFGSQVVKLWAALAVGAACLVVGLGVGVLVGHETTGSGSTNPQQPGVGGGQFPGQDGDGFGHRDFGGQGLGQNPGTQSDGQSGAGSGSGTVS